MNTRWNLAFCRRGVLGLQISRGRGTSLRASHGDRGVLTTETLLAPQLLSLLLLSRKAQLAAHCLIPVHLHPFPIPSLGAAFREGVGVPEQLERGVCGYFLFCPRLGSGLGDGGWGLPAASLAGRSLRAAQGCWWWWGVPRPRVGDPEPLFSSLSHAREFLPLDGSIRAKKPLWETLWDRGPSSRETFLPGYPASGRFVLGLRTCGFSSLVFAPFLPLMLCSLPCSVLGDHSQLPKSRCHVTSFACPPPPDAGGCRGTGWDSGAESQLGHSGPRPGAKQSQTGRREEMSTLMGHQNHGSLARCTPGP